MTQPSLLDLTYDELAELVAGWGQPSYRADQLWHWLYQQLVTDPASMANLPAELRERLSAEQELDPLTPIHEQRSRDGQTIKWLYRLPDGQTIESVLMLYERRRTVCISSQAGCAMSCVFCATGQGGLARNLTTGEIVAQVLSAARWLAFPPPESSRESARLSHIVVMGMGEPLANYERTWQALRILTDARGFDLGARHITVSTVGLVPGIRRMAEEPLQNNLAVSLHAPDDALRSHLVPINQRYPLAEVMAAVRDYIARTRRRVTFEYALMNGINDAPRQAHRLADLLRGVLCHVNLIPLNPVAESPYQPASEAAAAEFQAILNARGVPATVRLRRGLDIDAGCGQLRRRMGQS